MSRTLRGNLTGRAAALEKSDALANATERAPFSRRWNNAIDTLRELMGEDKFDEWFDSYPMTISKGQFILVMEAQVKSLSVTEQDADAVRTLVEALDTADWLDSDMVAESDGRNALEDEQLRVYYGKTKVHTTASWRNRHLHQTAEEVAEAKANAEMLKNLR